MRKKITFLLIMLCFFFISGHAQTQFWSDTFETGSPTSGTRVPEENGGTTPLPSASYFRLTDGSTVSQAVPFTGKEATNYWAGEDHNAPGTGFTASGAQGAVPANNPLNELQIDWNSINITGKSTLSFKGLFAANNFNQPWDNEISCGSGVGTTNTDYIIVEYKIDAGAWQSLIRFYNKGGASNGIDKYLYEETTGDTCGDGTMLTSTFGEFSKPIIGTGTTLSIRIRVFSEGANEEWGIDNFRLFEVPSCTAPSIVSNPPNRSICAGSNTTFSISATGATTYQWQVDTGSGFTNLTNTAPYSNVTTSVLTITGATVGMNGYKYRCTAINGVATCFTNSNFGTLNVSNITTTGSQTNISCAGTSTGNASVTPSGGIGGYTYSWSPSGGTGAIATGLAAGAYTVTVTDGIGCTATRNYTITETGTPINTATGSQTNVSCNGGTNGSASVTPSGGTPGYTYSWSPSGGTAATATGLAAGSYTVTVTDANGCTKTRNYTITQPSTINTATGSQTNVSCNGGTNGSASVSPSGGTPGYTYSWSPSGGTAATATGLAAGSYTVTITDANACTATRNYTITQPSAISTATGSQTNVSCNGGTNGSASVTPSGGTPGYTYSWSPSGGTAATATGLAAGSYTVTVTDANACTATRNYTITQPSTISTATGSQTNVSCNGGTNGSASVTPSGGTPGYTYSWSPSGGTAATATGLAAGSYTVTVTDANACTATRNYTITQPSTISTATGSQTNVSCNGGTNGSASVTPSGGTPGYTYSWSPSGGTAATATGLAAGSYTVTITDANACTATRNYTITQPSAISTATGSQTNVSCNGGTNGSASVTPSGGTPGYTYSWSPSGGTAATATGLAAGSYTVTITDANGCTATRNYTITQPSTISTATGSQTNVSCNGGTNGSASVTPSGGTPGYTYSWSPSGGTAATATGLAAGSYTVTITDANSCTATRNYTITQPSAISTATGSQTNVSCNGGTNGSASVTPSGGTPGYTYSWSPSGGTAATATGLAAGSYTVTITDANSCTATRNYTITQPSTISTATGSQTNVSCNGGTNGAASVTPSGGTPGYTYSWSPSGGTAATATGLAAGSYTVTVTDANGCTATRNYTINEPSAISTATGSQTNVSCNGGTNGSASVTPSGGTPGYTYSWSPSGGTAATATGLAAGSYTVTVTDANGCTATRNYIITEPSVIDSSVSLVGSTLTANQSGATYQWYECPNTIVPGETGQSFTPAISGTYRATITMGACSVDSSCQPVLDATSFETNQKFVIYPNPNSGVLNIKSDFDGDFQIVNQLGQTVRTFKILMNTTNTINLDNLSDGVYFIRGLNKTKINTQRLIIKK